MLDGRSFQEIKEEYGYQGWQINRVALGICD